MAKYKQLWKNYNDLTLIGYQDNEVKNIIPLDPGNLDYQNVLKWIADGNTPDPAFTPAEIAAFQAADANQSVVEAKITTAKNEINLSDLAGKTYQQAENWIETSVTDLASAKAALKKIAKIILAILKAQDLSA